MSKYEVTLVHPIKSKLPIIVTGSFDMDKIVKVAFEVDTKLIKKEGSYKRYYEDISGRKYLVENKDSLNVKLSYLDILNVIEHMCKNDQDLSKQVGPGGLEFLLFDAIRDLKGVDFFKEEEELTNHE